MGEFPNKSSQWKPGQSGNPGGKTSEHRKAEVRAAELAAIARLELVDAFHRLITGKETAEDRVALMNSDALRLLKDSEDRGFGSPQQHIDQTSSDGSMTPKGLAGFYEQVKEEDEDG